MLGQGHDWAPAGLVVSVEKETAALRTLNRNDFEPWYASNPSFKPPPGKAGHFTTDTEKQGVDSRKWRSIEWYDVINGRRRKMGDEWAPLDDRGKLIKPPGGKFMIPTAAAKAGSSRQRKKRRLSAPKRQREASQRRLGRAHRMRVCLTRRRFYLRARSRLDRPMVRTAFAAATVILWDGRQRPI